MKLYKLPDNKLASDFKMEIGLLSESEAPSAEVYTWSVLTKGDFTETWYVYKEGKATSIREAYEYAMIEFAALMPKLKIIEKESEA